jgi:purine-cytosine permease-like protein
LGLLTLVTVAAGDPGEIFGSFLAVPLGGLAFAVLAIRELDQSFADTYSTAVSVQNLRPRWDRRILVLFVGALTTVIALALNIGDYYNFLSLIASVFTPLLGVMVVDWFLISRGRWDLGSAVPARWATLIPWVLGFVAYQMINPGGIGWWARMWGHIDDVVGLTVQSWMSASILSFVLAALATLIVSPWARRP